MKNSLFLLPILLLLFNSCFSKTNEKTTRSMPLTEREKSLEAAKRLDALIARDNEEIDFDTLNKMGDIEIYVHNQILKLNDDKQKINIHLKPFSFTSDDIFFTAKIGDEVKVTHVLYSQKKYASCLFVTIPSGKTGFVPLSENPYKDGQFSFREEIIVNGNAVKVLKLNRQYTFESFTNDVATIQTQPDYASDVIARISNDIRLECQAITADYNWLCVTYENREGWINTKYLCRGIGGPVLNTPEEMICEELLWSGYR